MPDDDKALEALKAGLDTEEGRKRLAEALLAPLEQQLNRQRVERLLPVQQFPWPRSVYGVDDFDGSTIVAPKGWQIIPAGMPIPHKHREFVSHTPTALRGSWCWPRRCHSTMTPFVACVWGSVRAFAELMPGTPWSW